MTLEKYRVLVLCTGNSARSQMAEGLINTQLADRFVAYSAGTHPTGYVHPQAVAALHEIGIDISQQRSKSVAEFRDMSFDVVLTVCDDAARSIAAENCPVWLGQGQRVHLGFPDPAAARPDEQAQQFRAVRDAIQYQLLGYLRDWRPVAQRRNHDH
ncbi:MAG TPA: arsenate reductase ArsC [Anaerolineae bacterium]|nr:arsenate reductase ArsC [Anaerolineae bacterium]